jgi:chromosome segregation ATPase
MHQPTDKNAVWLNTTETILLVGSVGTSVASVVLQQVTFAAITSVQLSLVLGLNSLNRKRFDDLNQQNQNAIAQIHQQLKEHKPFNQIESTIRQLPNYQDIATLQQQLEQLKTDHPKQLSQQNQDITTLQRQLEQLKLDHPKRFNQLNQDIATLQQQLEQLKTDHQKWLNQLNEDINNQEHQFNQIHTGLNSLRQNADLTSRANTEALQNRIHELKADFEIKIRELEINSDRPTVFELKTRLNELEKSIHQLKLLANSENFKNLFNDHNKDIHQDFKKFRDQILHLDSSISSKVQGLSTKAQELENQIEKLQTAFLYQEGKPQQSNELNDQMKDLIELLQLEIDDLDERQKKLGNQLESHSSNVTQRFQKADIDLNVNFNELQEEIHKLRCYIDEIISQKPPQPPGIPNPSIPAETPISPQTVCDWCHGICTSIFVGGPYNNSQFCSKGCMQSYTKDWERNNEY